MRIYEDNNNRYTSYNLTSEDITCLTGAKFFLNEFLHRMERNEVEILPLNGEDFYGFEFITVINKINKILETEGVKQMR